MASRAPLVAPDRPPVPEVDAGGLSPELRSLVQTYVSYLSGCDACALESLRAARATEGDPWRLDLLATWRRAPLRTYSDRERIALVWAEVVAVSGEAGVGETLRSQASELFGTEELDALTRTVVATRGYRRLQLERVGDAPSRRRRSGRPSTCGSRKSCELCAAP